MKSLKPLSGIRVLEPTQERGMAFCGKYLAALGAEVTALDDGVGFRSPAHADEEASALADYLDVGKRVIKTCADSNLQASDDYDVILAGRSMNDPDRTVDNATIYVCMSEAGLVGPLSTWKGTELTAQALGGLLSLVGEAGRAPLQMGGHQVDYSMGALAFTGVMIALSEREKSGLGQIVRVSRLETVAYLEWKGRVFSQAGAPLRRGTVSGPLIVKCQDGDFGFYYREQNWPQILELFPLARLREEMFASHSSRIAHTAELTSALEEVTLERSRDELYEMMQAVGVPVGPVYTTEDLLKSPQYRALEFMESITEDGVVALSPSLPVLFNGSRV